jgi:hypothetical protein
VRRLGIAAVVLVIAGCGGPAQIGPDEDCFKAVDALYTAVTARNPKLLDQCEQHLQGLKTAGKLPEAAFNSLSAIVRKARDGKWQPAAEDLSDFMKGQRRARK